MVTSNSALRRLRARISRSGGRRDPFSVTLVDLLLADPVTQRLGVHPNRLDTAVIAAHSLG